MLTPIQQPEAPNVPLLLGTRKKHSKYRFLLDPPKKRSPPEKRSTKSPSSIQRKAGIVTCVFFGTRLRIFALVLRTFALVLHFDFCSLLSNIQQRIILEDRPARFWENRPKQGKVQASGWTVSPLGGPWVESFVFSTSERLWGCLHWLTS